MAEDRHRSAPLRNDNTRRDLEVPSNTMGRRRPSNSSSTTSIRMATAMAMTITEMDMTRAMVDNTMIWVTEEEDHRSRGTPHRSTMSQGRMGREEEDVRYPVEEVVL